GVGRRFERVGEVGGVMVVDDYAHHPTEVQATLAAARQAFPRRRVVAVFQPHLFSRTALHGDALGRALAAADVVVVAPIYGAREQPLPGVSAALVARGAVRAGATTVALRLGPRASVFGDTRLLADRVRGLAGVAEARVVRRLPAVLSVELREVEPAALVVSPRGSGRGLVAVDAAGRPLPFDPARSGLDLPIAASGDSGVVAVLALIQSAAAAAVWPSAGRGAREELGRAARYGARHRGDEPIDRCGDARRRAHGGRQGQHGDVRHRGRARLGAHFAWGGGGVGRRGHGRGRGAGERSRARGVAGTRSRAAARYPAGVRRRPAARH